MSFISTYPTLKDFQRSCVELCPEISEPQQWVTRGVTGGSCYGGELYHFESQEEPPESPLDDLLERIVPTLLFSQYRRVINTPVETTVVNTKWHYYGNYDEVATRTIDLQKLYDLLCEINP